MSNLYRPHPFMIDSGTFWRCPHGETGVYYACWHCGLWHPFKFVRHLFDIGRHTGEWGIRKND